MKCSTWLFVASVVFAATGCKETKSGTQVDASPDGPMCKPPIGFTFSAIEDRSLASFGWTGTVHNVRVTDGTPFGVKVTHCDGCDGVCTFEGPVAPKGAVNRRRCLNRMSITCEQDSDCPNDNTPYRTCVFMYDPPAATPLVGLGGKRGACAWSYIPNPGPDEIPTIMGTIDQASGELNIQNLQVYLPLNGAGGMYRGACVECIGDDIANDGIKNGICMQTGRGGPDGADDPSPDIGQPCDIHRYGNVPGYEGNYSMDCSPTVRANDGTPNIFGGVFTSSGYQIEITESSPDCTDPAFAGEKCFCGACPDGVTSCLSDADCGGAKCGYLPPNCDPNPLPFTDQGTLNPDYNPMFAPGQCRGATTNTHITMVGGNSCRNGLCDWDPEAGVGTCISKLTNQPVGCYPSGIGTKLVAPGGARRVGSVYIADTGTARCNRFVPSAVLNAQLGLPGLTFQKRSFRIIPEYPE
jgi:hypothetical protein